MFLEWLISQNKRKDQIGWLSRLISSSETSQEEMKPLSGDVVVKKYANSFPNGKIKTALIAAHEEWIKVAYGPKVGIFWIINKDIISFSQEALATPLVAGFKDGTYDHVTMWSTVQRMYPQMKNQEYLFIPRGRVLGVGQSNFRIFLPPEMANDLGIVGKVMREFSLPRNTTEVMGDEHYSLQDLSPDMGDEFDDNYDPFDD